MRNSIRSIGSIIALFSATASLAWDLPQTPPINNEGVSVMPTDFSGQTQENEGSGTSENKNPPRVRIGLRLTPYRKVVYSTEIGTETKFKEDSVVTHTLRARMDRPNHFFVSDFHIETTPLAWEKQSGVYKIRLAFFRRFGSYGQIEESIGKLDLSGHLKGEKGLYVLNGTAAVNLKDKRGSAVLDIVAGFPEPQKPRAKAWSENSAAPKEVLSKARTNFRALEADELTENPAAVGTKRVNPPARPLTEEQSEFVKRVNPIAQPTPKNAQNGWKKELI